MKDSKNKPIFIVLSDINVLIDKEDYFLIAEKNWFIVKRGSKQYVVTNTKEGQIYLHRYLLKANEEQIIDHINGNGLDNRRLNLRFCTSTENNQNRRVIKINKTGYKGVQLRGTRFTSKIIVNKKDIWLGTYLTVEEAAQAYNAAAIKYFGEFASLNIITSNKTCL